MLLSCRPLRLALIIVSLGLPLASAVTIPVPGQTRDDGEAPTLGLLHGHLQQKDYESAVTLLRELLSRDGDHFRLYNLLGATLDRMERFEEAAQAYNRSLELEPRASMVRLNRALNLLRQGRVLQAAEDFRLLIEQTRGGTPAPPPNPYQQAPLGPEAERFARLLRAEESEFSEVGTLFLTHHFPEGALAVFSVGTERLPRSARLHELRGWALQELGRFEEARESFRRALELAPEFMQACLRLGYSYYTSGENENATETYQNCVKFGPDHYAAHYFLGTHLLRLGAARADEAVTYLERAVQLNPHSADSRVQLGKAYSMKGLQEPALRHLRVAVRENPENEEAHYLLGRVFQSLGRTGEATDHLRRFEALKARARDRDRQNMQTGLIGSDRTDLSDVVESVVSFYAQFKELLLHEDYLQVWEILTEPSRTLYHHDPERFRDTLVRVYADPEVLNRLRRSSISGGRVVGGRIICEFEPVDGISFPPLVLVREGEEIRIDYAFDLSLAGLAHLGARPSLR